MKIAIIGRAGTGKTTVAKLFLPAGYKVIYCDEVVHEVYSKPGVVFEYISKWFGNCIVNDKIDRKLLGDYLVSRDNDRKLLERFLFLRIFFPLIQREENVIVDGLVPEYLTPEFSLYIKFDMILYAYVDEDTRHERLLKRDVSKERIEQIDKMQDKWKPYLLKLIE